MAGRSPPSRPDRLRIAGTMLLGLVLYSIGWLSPAIQRGFHFAVPLILPWIFGVWLVLIVLAALAPAEED